MCNSREAEVRSDHYRLSDCESSPSHAKLYALNTKQQDATEKIFGVINLFPFADDVVMNTNT